MSAYVHHIVHASEHPVVAIVIAACRIASEIAARNTGPILLLKAFWIAPDITNHAGPWVADNEKALAIVLDRLALGVHNIGENSRQRKRSRTGFKWYRSRHRRNHDRAGFGLPPGIHNRAAFLSDHLVVPLPRCGVDRLSY